MIYPLPPLDEPVQAQLAELSGIRRELGHQLRDAAGWSGTLRRVAWAEAIRSSTAIEGFEAAPDEALAIVEQRGPRRTGAETVAAIDGYRRAMEKVVVLAGSPDFDWRRSDLLLLHADVAHGAVEAQPGRFRERAVHLTDARGRVVFEPPEALAVPELTGEMCEWLRSAEATTTPPVVRAAMAHLHLAVIHPFVDGNGRMARVLHSLVLAREGELAPSFASIESFLGRHTQAYYAALAAASPGGRYDPASANAGPWVRFAIQAHLIQALEHKVTLSEAGARFRLCTRLVTEIRLPERAASALDQALLSLTLRNDGYRSEHGVSRPTATRDLAALQRAGLLESRGEGRAVEYVAAEPLLHAWDEARSATALPDIERRIRELADGLTPPAATPPTRELRPRQAIFATAAQEPRLRGPESGPTSDMPIAPVPKGTVELSVDQRHRRPQPKDAPLWESDQPHGARAPMTTREDEQHLYRPTREATEQAHREAARERGPRQGQ